ncbi:hypothetical protein [Rhodovulum sp. MB263]|uniref:hypothetical protein n=1 Tax=unclassified Rhodovulum TaxID=2631432 RepID=UPI0009B7808C|nr:hypothetical protein [Rhodovulum sp. MB263]ARC89505.1 hypothetical protein B5V46_13275 [Rhodovulum sp. MB263]
MPKLVTLYIRQAATGFALSGVFVGLLMYFDVANLWHLVTSVSGGWLAALLLFLFNGVVFAGVQFGIAVMAMARDDGPDSGRRRSGPVHGLADVLVPIPVPVKDERRMRR